MVSRRPARSLSHVASVTIHQSRSISHELSVTWRGIAPKCNPSRPEGPISRAAARAHHVVWMPAGSRLPWHRGVRRMASGEQQSVVIVEDDPSMRQALGRILRVAGYAPLAYESAEAFMEDKSATGATCMIFDVQLPGITGFELRDRLARDGRDVPVIFITAYDEPDARQRASRAGAVAY